MKYKVLELVNPDGLRERRQVSYRNEDEEQQLKWSGETIEINDPKAAMVMVATKLIEPIGEDITTYEPKPKPEIFTATDETTTIYTTTEEPTDRYSELKALNRKQQYKLAKKLGVKGYSRLSEDDLIEAIMKAE
jgi:hypothetical protein